MIDKTEFESQLLKTLQTRELAAAISKMIDTVRQIWESILNSLAEQEAALTWAAVYHPRLYHCAKYSKRLRIQSKNITRIVKLYRKAKEK